MMSGSKDDAESAPSDVGVPTEDDTHTSRGAPTDTAHRDAGDGSLTGAIPAGLTSDELKQAADSDQPNDGGTG